MSFNHLYIGVLGLQGAYAKHIAMLEKLGVQAFRIRYPDEIDTCDGLILPGGETTTMTKIIDEIDIRGKLQHYNGPIFGTCAGAVLLSQNSNDPRVPTFGRVPIQARRNAWGRQVESFTTAIQLSFSKKPYKAVFIRAPKLTDPTEDVQILATLNHDIVLVEFENILLATFHPELTDDPRIHKYFIEKIKKG
jgi:5'-phosphate synthase pdxT subunit